MSVEKSKIILLVCPFCDSDDLATGPDWMAQSTETEQKENLTEYICRECDRSFWI